MFSLSLSLPPSLPPSTLPLFVASLLSIAIVWPWQPPGAHDKPHGAGHSASRSSAGKRELNQWHRMSGAGRISGPDEDKAGLVSQGWAEKSHWETRAVLGFCTWCYNDPYLLRLSPLRMGPWNASRAAPWKDFISTGNIW